MKTGVCRICRLCLLAAVVALVFVWLGRGGFKNLMLQHKLRNLSCANLSQEEEWDSISAATPKVIKEALFYRKSDDRIQCQLCPRKCIISDGGRGFCRVRENRHGKLYSLVYSLPSAVHIDPIEKEPQLHNFPGTDILCIGTVGCNFKCLHCQNWHLSQSSPGELETYYLPPEKVVKIALERKIPAISFTYNDPIVCYEYLYDVSVLAKQKGVRTLWHSNGFINPEPLREILKYTDAVTIDLKGFTKKAYKNSSAELEPVLETLKIIKEEGVWLEIVNLVIPGLNDEAENIKRMCEWIKKNLGEDVPLHFSRFSPSYKLIKLPPTPIKTLEQAYGIAKDAGLHYVTLGNVPGHKHNSTFCPECGKRLIHRTHFQVLKNNIIKGKCKFCGHKIPGLWGDK